MRGLIFSAAFVFVSAAAAQESSPMSAVQKSLEMPGHRSLIAVIADPQTQLTPFETDGCSGGMSWSWRVVADVFPNFADAQGSTPPWEVCCVDHDRVYHDAGGAMDAEESFAARLAADEALRQCVAAPEESDVAEMSLRYGTSEEQVIFAFDLIATSMYNAVRFGGGPCSGLPWRWGYGYPGCVPGF